MHTAQEKVMTIRRLIFAFALTLALSPVAHANQKPAVNVTPLLSTRSTASGQPIDVPVHPEVLVSRYEIAPHATLAMHKHPYPRYAYVLSGTLEVTVLGGKTYMYKAGDFIVEVVGQWHSARNTGDTPVRLIVIDQVVPGHSNVILRSEKAPSR